MRRRRRRRLAWGTGKKTKLPTRFGPEELENIRNVLPYSY
jgi:hypothetical protein